MNFKKLFLNMAIVGLLCFALMSFIITTQVGNNSENLITNNSLINESYGDLYDNLGSTQSNADESDEKFGQVTPTENYGIVSVSSIVSPTTLYKGVIKGTYNILIALPVNILGVPPIVASIISSIIILLIIVGVWAIWKGSTN